ncbi:putative restriction endonuclease [Fibrella aestuarina BUZ 2]|uniref:Putative restriction endonuclease n=1 Tax=Fibrella aestuarina BUZ 2 TaxID=1166018 RepID=I0K7Q9_9BACT|nr:HNH endonuclease [Fibrella aestuarina]CCH00162.1 putative restriction endonuclease [Fibrella aestuarina BUZ 2]
MADRMLNFYIHAFSNLNVGGGKLNEKAPHKPILLLTVVQAYETGLLTDNQIPITPELTSLFKSNWNRIVTSGHTLGFALPFFHLKNEKGSWWELVANPGCELWVQYGRLTSFGNLSVAVAQAQIDPNLAQLLMDETTRQVLRGTLLDTYFPGQSVVHMALPAEEIDGLTREMVDESPTEYRARLKDLKTRLDPETYQIEIYTRDTVFRREVVRLYDDTCCVTGVRVSAPYSFSMVDACHIMPFAKTFNNHPTNGIALCPNLHRAFDKGAISVDEHYRVIVSDTFVENESSLYSLKSLAGTSINLPGDARYQPDLAAFAWHRTHVFRS